MSSNLNDYCDILEENFKRYKNILFPPKILDNTTAPGYARQLKELYIEILDDSCPKLYPYLNMDESCIFSEWLNVFL